MCSIFYKRQSKALEVVNPVVFLSFLIFDLIEKNFYRSIQKFKKKINETLITCIAFSSEKQFSGFEIWKLLVPFQHKYKHILSCQK